MFSAQVKPIPEVAPVMTNTFPSYIGYCQLPLFPEGKKLNKSPTLHQFAQTHFLEDATVSNLSSRHFHGEAQVICFSKDARACNLALCLTPKRNSDTSASFEPSMIETDLSELKQLQSQCRNNLPPGVRRLQDVKLARYIFSF